MAESVPTLGWTMDRFNCLYNYASCAAVRLASDRMDRARRRQNNELVFISSFNLHRLCSIQKRHIRICLEVYKSARSTESKRFASVSRNNSNSSWLAALLTVIDLILDFKPVDRTGEYTTQ